MTKAIRIHAAGGSDKLVYEDVELAPPGPGQVLVRHHAIGVNFIDVYLREGQYPIPSYPAILGNEAAGVVTALGKGVEGFKVGDRVAYVGTLGSYAEERVVDAKILLKLPKEISFETAAGMMLKGLTAQYLLRRTYKVKAGDTILVQAAAGGVGLLLCQWGKALGATVIGTVGTADKAKLAKKAGAKHTILYRDEDFVARVNEITKGKKCDVVYDGVGKTTFPGSLDCLRPMGMFVSFGASSGPIDSFNIGMLAQKGSLFATRPSLYAYMAKREDLEKMARDLFKVVKNGDVNVPIHHKIALKDAAKAHDLLETRQTTGSVILIP